MKQINEKTLEANALAPDLPLTKEGVATAAKKRLSLIHKEFAEAFTFISKYPKSVSFFGSARLKENNIHYIKAAGLSQKLAKLGYTIVTGGGPGIMEAANRGAFEAGGQSVGLNIKLSREQRTNKYLTDKHDFYYFFVRKVALSFAAEAYIFFPGGFGTLDEFFEIITLIQTKKIAPVPVVLVGLDYWGALDAFIRKELSSRHHAISKGDLDLYTVLDDDDEILKAVTASEVVVTPPLHNGQEA